MQENNPKSRSLQHVIDDDAKDLFYACIPNHWVVHEYKPDYGIDFVLEIFEDPKGRPSFPTLGEHIFIQLKGTQTARYKKLKIEPRYNVEKEIPITWTSRIRQDEDSIEISVCCFSLETSELLTVQRMSPALPVLLMVADIERRQVLYVCLNDYIDKILTPKYGVSLGEQKSHTIYLPCFTMLSPDERDNVSDLRWYGKRPKFYSAFQKIWFQYQELENLSSYRENIELARQKRFFASILLRYDFWEDHDIWGCLQALHKELKRVESQQEEAKVNNEVDGFNLMETLLYHRDIVLWETLANLSRIYEDICREWYLPSWLGVMTLYKDDNG